MRKPIHKPSPGEFVNLIDFFLSLMITNGVTCLLVLNLSQPRDKWTRSSIGNVGSHQSSDPDRDRDTLGADAIAASLALPHAWMLSARRCSPLEVAAIELPLWSRRQRIHARAGGQHQRGQHDQQQLVPSRLAGCGHIALGHHWQHTAASFRGANSARLS